MSMTGVSVRPAPVPTPAPRHVRLRRAVSVARFFRAVYSGEHDVGV